LNTFNPEWSLVMTLKNLCKTLNATAMTGGTFMAASALAAAPRGASGYGMGSDTMGGHGAGWMDGGYGGIWLTVVVVIVVAGLVAWIVAQKRK
jgi:hypothetical protein